MSIFNQGNLSGIPAAKDSKQRFEILEEILELSIYSELEEVTKKQYITDLNKEIALNTSLIQSIGSPQKEIKILKDAIELNNNSIISIEQLLAQKNQSLAQANQEYELLKDSLNVQNEQELVRKQALQKITDITFNLNEKNQKLLSSTSKLNDKNQELVALGSKVQQLRDNLISLKTKYDNLLKEKVDVKSDIEEKLKTVEQNELKSFSQLGVLQHKLKDLQHLLPEHEVCDECLQNISQEYRFNHTIKTETTKSALNVEITEIQKQLLGFKSKKETHKTQLKQIDIHQNSIIATKNLLDSAEQQINQHITVGKKSREVAQIYVDEIKALESEIKSLKEQKDSLEKNLISTQDDKADDLLKLKNLTAELTVFINREQQNFNKNQIEIAVNKEKLKAQEENLTKFNNLQDQQLKLKYDLSILQEIAISFGNYIPKNIIYGMLDSLQKQVSYWINKINSEISIVFKIEKKNNTEEDLFNIFYVKDGIEFDWIDLSGGEKFQVNMCFKFALSDVIKKLTNNEILMFCFDELDERAVVAALKLFEERWHVGADGSDSFAAWLFNISNQQRFPLVRSRRTLYISGCP